jgi:hypothetical protein
MLKVKRMSKFPHDDFAKAYLTELLSTIGKATPNRSLKAETRIADLWFELNPQAANQRHELGLLGQLLTRNALIEVFRNPATPLEVRACQSKLSHLEGDLFRKAKRRKQSLTEANLPDLWLIMPTASTEIRDGFGCVPTAIAGVYEFPVLQRIGLIVVHQLAKTEETLWLRILGRSGEQQRAIEEFTQHSSENGLHASIEELLTDYRANLESRRQLTPEDEELIMNLSAAYLKKQQEWKQAGLEQSRHEIATNLLREGVAVELIVKATGLSMAEVEGLATATASQPSS